MPELVVLRVVNGMSTDRAVEVGADALSYPTTTPTYPQHPRATRLPSSALASAAHRRRLTDDDVAELVCPTDVDTSTRPASTARLLSEAADGQSAARSASLQLPLPFLQVTRASGREGPGARLGRLSHSPLASCEGRL